MRMIIRKQSCAWLLVTLIFMIPMCTLLVSCTTKESLWFDQKQLYASELSTLLSSSDICKDTRDSIGDDTVGRFFWINGSDSFYLESQIEKNRNTVVSIDGEVDQSMLAGLVLSDDEELRDVVFANNCRSFFLENTRSHNMIMREGNAGMDSLSEIALDFLQGDSLVGVCGGKNGELVIAGTASITVMDSERKIRQTYRCGNEYIASINSDSEGAIYTTELEDNTWYLCSRKSADLKLLHKYAIETDTPFNDVAVLGSTQNGDLIVLCDGSVYSLPHGEKNAKKQISLDDNGFLAKSNMIDSIGDGIRFVALSSANTIEVFQLRFSEIVNAKKTITLLTDSDSFDGDSLLAKSVILFNRQNHPYHINVIQRDILADESKICADILSGNGPDIIYTKQASLVKRMSALDLCLDLLPCLSSYDDFDESDYYQGIWNSGKTSDNRLLYVAPFFKIHALWTYEDIAKENYTETWSKMELLKNSGEYSHVFRNISAVSLFWHYWETMMEDELTVEKIKDFICFCDNLSDPYNETSPVAAQIQSRDFAFLEYSIGSWGEFILLSEYYRTTPVACSLPQLKTLSASSESYLLATANTKNQDGVGCFVHYVLSQEMKNVTMSDMSRNAFVRKDINQAYTLSLSEKYMNNEDLQYSGVILDLYTENEEQELDESLNSGRKTNNIIKIDNIDNSIELYNHYLDEVRLLVEDDALFNLIWEEAQLYYQKQCSLEQLADVLEARIRQYTNEMK